MLICLQSDQSPTVNPSNTPVLFTCTLPEHYNLDTQRRGRWYLGLQEIVLPSVRKGNKWDALYVCCQGCETSPLGGMYKPIIASLSLGEIKRNNFTRFSPVHYVPLRVQSLSQLTVEIYCSEGEILEDLKENSRGQATKCTFELKWMKDTSPWRP